MILFTVAGLIITSLDATLTPLNPVTLGVMVIVCALYKVALRVVVDRPFVKLTRLVKAAVPFSGPSPETTSPPAFFSSQLIVLFE